MKGNKIMRAITKEYHEKSLDEMRIDCAITQKKGVPFIMAAVLIWAGIGILHLTGLKIETKNLITFCFSALFMPLALIFAHFLKVKITDRVNPLSKVGFLFTLNQFLYILIVMWVYSERPEGMVMAYAVVVAAHLLPFSWLYRSLSYRFAAIIGSIVALVLGCLTTPAVVAFTMSGILAVLVTALISELRKMNQ
jgi:hypothetical protein